MNKPATSSTTAFGFISVREIDSVGYCGGLLIVSQIGRPLEFHCSTPVGVNRAQKILYGRTYEKYLFCEQIALSLIDKASKTPAIYIADSAPLLELNGMIDHPVVLLGNDKLNATFQDPSSYRTPSRQPVDLDVDGQKIWYVDDFPGESLRVKTLTGSFTKTIPLDEPFERIQNAIDEAQAVRR